VTSSWCDDEDGVQIEARNCQVKNGIVVLLHGSELNRPLRRLGIGAETVNDR